MAATGAPAWQLWHATERTRPAVVRFSALPSSLLALVPQLMGFEPQMSIVRASGRAASRRADGCSITLRFDLPKRA